MVVITPRAKWDNGAGLVSIKNLRGSVSGVTFRQQWAVGFIICRPPPLFFLITYLSNALVTCFIILYLPYLGGIHIVHKLIQVINYKSTYLT